MKRIRNVMLIMTMIFISFFAAGRVRAAGGPAFTGEIYENCIYPGGQSDCFYFVTRDYVDSQYKYTVKRYDLATNAITVKYTITDVANGVDLYYRDDTLYYIAKSNTLYNGASDCPVYKIDLRNGTRTVHTTIHLEGGLGRSVAVDGAGRVYLYDHNSKLYVFGADGKQLAKTSSTVSLLDIIGIDEVNHNIYYQGTCNWVYWGYDHRMCCLNVARWKSDGTIVIPEENHYITIQYQDYFYKHYGCAEWLGDDCRYIADLSTFSSETLFVLDSRYIDPAAVGESSTTISLLDSGVSVTGVNVDNDKAVVLAAGSRDSVYEDDLDVGSVGSRAVVIPIDGKDALLVLTDARTVTCYDLATEENIGVVNAAADVYKIMRVGNQLVLLEKNDTNWSVETVSMNVSTSMSVQGSKTLNVGSSAKYTVKFNGGVQVPYTFESSDPSVLSVSSAGVGSAWAPGTAVITVKTKDGRLSAATTVTVSEKSETADGMKRSTKISTTSKKSNKSKNNYSTYGSIVSSYLTQLADGNLMICNIDGNTLLAEYFDTTGKKNGTNVTITGELDRICGFYAGSDAWYVVCCQNNSDEDDSREIIRVIKYSKAWKRLSACTIRGNNTTTPVSAGSLRMAEAGGILYVHTCHTMYKSSDGLNHESNMTFSVKESDMSLIDIYSGVMNISYGYVSHSFNEFVVVSNGYVYRANHGDAYPRGMVITRIPTGGTVSGKVSGYATFGGFNGSTGDNYTGASLGGLGVSATHAFVVYNQEIASGSSVRNIIVGTWGHVAGTAEIHPVTEYADTNGYTCGTPQLVKLNNNQYLLMWEETSLSSGSKRTAFTYLDATGMPVGDIVRESLPLSDCQPILLKDGTVAWYVCDGTNTYLYDVNPYSVCSLNITKQPEDVTSVVGNTVSFRVTATGTAPISYQWQVLLNGRTEWVNSGAASAKTSNLTMTLQSGHNNMKVRCIITDANGNKKISDTVVCKTAASPYIKTQPQDFIGTVGSTATFRTEAVGSGGVSYQWQVLLKGRTSWVNSGAASAKTATFKLTVQEGHLDMKVRCVITDGNNTQKITDEVGCYEAVALAITSQPVSKTVPVGGTAEFSVVAKGTGPITYQWQFYNPNTQKWTSSSSDSAKTATFSLTAQAAHQGFKFRCIVTDMTGAAITSGAATVTVRPGLTSQPKNATVAFGEQAEFTIGAKGCGTLSYQWQVWDNANSTWKNSGSASAKTATFGFAAQAGHNGKKFRCIVSDSNGNKTYSQTVTLTVIPAITAQPKALTVPVGGTAEFSVTANWSGSLSYQWQFYNPNSQKWTNSVSASAKTSTFSMTAQAAHQGFKFRCVITDGNGNKTTSAEALLKVRPGIVTQPKDITVAVGGTVSLSITAQSAGTLSYQWQVWDTATESWKNSSASSAKTANFTFTAQKGHNGKKFRCVLTDSNGNQTVSRGALVTVK